MIAILLPYVFNLTNMTAIAIAIIGRVIALDKANKRLEAITAEKVIA